ncbi:spermidine/putrescine ABC transporter substrate-binding protein [Bradyrhizobium sacchari]|uniref:Putative spermidine/putrescine transport system substrate-binding protein n=1 Tax=Bradyrhizobium sacchari TaxID=1399419 RepID=A0A560J3R9_9BRAD|nr:ABC transporter substrate-binding protein [Bradyrhizobium sacchari]OPY95435.1 spermidine/putrescine ABC transporter substrate-binding protein [Bradyrhizobium sacchari]TWB46995.1 putative spermidine/putrescine transport system substrate-binding protein [Bradyrhizobium sacchari]TWB65893.1 putative spermidine/putrescine transport system substrate-binding protein [Bradyrhizobium sacchari]
MSKTPLTNVAALAAIGLAAAGLAPAEPAFASDQLTITSFGGAYQAAERKALFEPYAMQAGVKITEDGYNGEFAKISAMVESKSVTWDVVDADANATIRLCADGVLETIDWKKLGLDRTRFTDGNKYDCGVPNTIYATVLAYDKDKLPNGPKTIADLFDVQKFPGKRGLLRSPFGNLEWALIADGVQFKDVYKVLNTSEGVDRAFKKLDTIKKDILWWQTNAQPPQLLADGQVIMTSAGNGRIYDANKNSGKHFEIVWDAQELGMNVWTIPNGGPRRDAAYKFIAFAGSPQAQANQTNYSSYGPANKDAIVHVDPAILPHLPTTPDHMANALQVDPAFWADKGDDLRQRFTAWLAK